MLFDAVILSGAKNLLFNYNGPPKDVLATLFQNERDSLRQIPPALLDRVPLPIGPRNFRAIPDLSRFPTRVYNCQVPLVSIHSLIPNAEDLLALEPEELAGVLLEHLNSLENSGQFLCREIFFLEGRSPADAYPEQYRDRINNALTEAWFWLEREVLLAPRPGNPPEFLFITRRGKSLANRQQFDSYRHASLLPKNLLHPLIAQRVYPAFLRGEYDTAIFQAFREVEVAVRQAGGYSAGDLGTPLMRAAFSVAQGPLTDKSAIAAEQQAMSDLFAGAIGLFKNPTSHRTQANIGPAEAVEIIMLASHLLRIVEQRSGALQSNP